MDYLLVDKQKLHAIASEQRIDILKLLNRSRHTLSELAISLKTTKSNLHVHLEKLEKAGLVAQIDEGRKWKYYTLTQQGQELIGGKSLAKPIILLLVSIMLMVTVGIFMLATLSDAFREAAVQNIDSEYTVLMDFDYLISLGFLLILEVFFALLFILGLFKLMEARSKL